MNVSKENVVRAVNARYADADGNPTKSRMQMENLVAQVEAVLDVTRDRPGWSAAEIHSLAASSCHLQVYQESQRKPR